MNILWLSHFLPFPPKGGLLQRSHHLLQQASAHHCVTLVALNQRALLTEPAALEEATEVLDQMVGRFIWHQIPADQNRLRWNLMAAASYFRRTPFDVNWFRSAAMRRTLSERLGRDRFDLVHVDTIGLLPYTQFFPGVPVVLNHHNIESDMMVRRLAREPSRLKRLYFSREAKKLARMERKACPRVAVNLVVSELDAERLQRVSAQCRIRVVSNGVDVEYFRPSVIREPRPCSLIFVGGMNWYPNRDAVLHFLADIWPMLLLERPECTLTVVGNQPPAALVEATRDPRVRAPGFVDDVRPYFEEAEVYVCPIRDGGGTRLKILDALAMAKPIVATGLAVEGLGLTEGTHYLRAETAEDFLRQLGRLAGDPGLRSRLSSEGRALVEARYSWGIVGRELLGAYESVARTSSPDASTQHSAAYKRQAG